MTRPHPLQTYLDEVHAVMEGAALPEVQRVVVLGALEDQIESIAGFDWRGLDRDEALEVLSELPPPRSFARGGVEPVPPSELLADRPAAPVGLGRLAAAALASTLLAVVVLAVVAEVSGRDLSELGGVIFVLGLLVAVAAGAMSWRTTLGRFAGATGAVILALSLLIAVFDL